MTRTRSTRDQRNWRRRSWRWNSALGIVLATATAAAFLLLRPHCATARETIVVVLPPLLGVILLIRWPKTRRVSIVAILSYLAIMFLLITGAVALVANIAGGKIIWTEIPIVVYFALGWRLAWEVWSRSVGTMGQRYQRLGRRTWRCRREHLSARDATIALCRRFAVPAARIATTTLIFVPLFLSSVFTLRLKIANGFDPQSYASMPFEQARFTTHDGLTLDGWYMPDATADETLIICHGLGANKGNFFEFVRVFYTQRYNVLIFDFRGHGDSDGHTSGMGTLEHLDVLAAVDWLKKNHAKGARHIYGLGSSMGAAALLRAARESRDFDALILDSCYASTRTLAEQHGARLPLVGPVIARMALFFVRLNLGLDGDYVEPIDAVAEIDRPVFFIHAKHDVVIGSENLQMLFERAKEPKSKWLGPGTHSNILTADFEGYQRRVLQFLQEVRDRRNDRPPIRGAEN